MSIPLKALFVLLFIALSVPVLAQSSKVGYVDFDTICAQLPETKQFKQQMEADKQKLQKELESKRSVLVEKVNAFYASYPTTELVNTDTTLTSKFST